MMQPLAFGDKDGGGAWELVVPFGVGHVVIGHSQGVITGVMPDARNVSADAAREATCFILHVEE